MGERWVGGWARWRVGWGLRRGRALGNADTCCLRRVHAVKWRPWAEVAARIERGIKECGASRGAARGGTAACMPGA